MNYGNTLDYELVNEDDYHHIYKFDTENNTYTLTLDEFPVDDESHNPWDDFPTVLQIEFITQNLHTGVRGSQSSTDNTNIGEPQLIQVYSTIASLVVDYVTERSRITEVICSGDAKKSPIYARLMKSNIARMLPEFKLAGPTHLMRIEDEDEFNSIQAQRQANTKRPNM